MLSKEMIVVIAVIVLAGLAVSAIVLGWALAFASGAPPSARSTLEDAALGVGAYVLGVVAVTVLKIHFDNEQYWFAGCALLSVGTRRIVTFSRRSLDRANR